MPALTIRNTSLAVIGFTVVSGADEKRMMLGRDTFGSHFDSYNIILLYIIQFQ